jgi:CBS domain-containing protein
MSLHHVHTILVTDPADGSLWGVLSDKALLSGLLDFDEGQPLLREVADRDLITISSDEPLLAAAELMRERGIAHLVVRDAQNGRPSGCSLPWTWPAWPRGARADRREPS